jgi:hypothetical protein
VRCGQEPFQAGDGLVKSQLRASKSKWGGLCVIYTLRLPVTIEVTPLFSGNSILVR